MCADDNYKLVITPLIPITAIISFTVGVTAIFLNYRRSEQEKSKFDFPCKNNTLLFESNNFHNIVQNGYESLIGNTPLMKLEKLSRLLGNGKTIYAKMECMNPGGTGKDRAALSMLKDAERRDFLPPPTFSNIDINITRMNSLTTYDNDNFHLKYNSIMEFHSIISTAISRSRSGGIVVEGTSGSTGISLAALSSQRGHSLIIIMPNDQAKEKIITLELLGALVHVVPNVAISNPNHYVNVATMIVEIINRDYRHRNKYTNNRDIRAAFMNQFENESNYDIHYQSTGRELWNQTNCSIDVFCMSCGTGGTISGVGRYLKDRSDGKCRIILVDPPGSVLYNQVKYNVAFTREQKEQSLLRHRYDSIVEGVGLDRITHNFSLAIDAGVIDDAVRISDQEAVDVAHWLSREEGIFVGSSSAMNIAAAVKVAEELGEGKCVTTIICDGGQRHLTRFWNKTFILDCGMLWPEEDEFSWKQRLPSCMARALLN